jgi:GT2 family glycosyltransferase
MLVNRARNFMIMDALKEDYDYIWFMDDDNIPENPKTLDIMIDMCEDIVTGIYTSRV